MLLSWNLGLDIMNCRFLENVKNSPLSFGIFKSKSKKATFSPKFYGKFW